MSEIIKKKEHLMPDDRVLESVSGGTATVWSAFMEGTIFKHTSDYPGYRSCTYEFAKSGNHVGETKMCPCGCLSIGVEYREGKSKSKEDLLN